MDVLIYLIPAALFLGAAERILMDDDDKPSTRFIFQPPCH